MKKPYSETEAIAYATVLMVFLWWIPVLGPITVGYLAGRRAGGPIKGIIAVTAPLFLYFLIIYSLQSGWFVLPRPLDSYIYGSVLPSVSPQFTEKIFKTAYMVRSLDATLHMVISNIPSALVIIYAFAFVGGAVSRQKYMEQRLKYVKPARINAKTLQPRTQVRTVVVPAQVMSDRTVVAGPSAIRTRPKAPSRKRSRARHDYNIDFV